MITQGPWQFEKHLGIPTEIDVFASPGYTHIAQVRGLGREDDARLIAAAPDLLAAAEAVISHFGVVPGDHGCVLALRDAIAKARGVGVRS